MGLVVRGYKGPTKDWVAVLIEKNGREIVISVTTLGMLPASYYHIANNAWIDRNSLTEEDVRYLSAFEPTKEESSFVRDCLNRNKKDFN